MPAMSGGSLSRRVPTLGLVLLLAACWWAANTQFWRPGSDREGASASSIPQYAGRDDGHVWRPVFSVRGWGLSLRWADEVVQQLPTDQSACAPGRGEPNRVWLGAALAVIASLCGLVVLHRPAPNTWTRLTWSGLLPAVLGVPVLSECVTTSTVAWIVAWTCWAFVVIWVLCVLYVRDYLVRAYETLGTVRWTSLRRYTNALLWTIFLDSPAVVVLLTSVLLFAVGVVANVDEAATRGGASVVLCLGLWSTIVPRLTSALPATAKATAERIVRAILHAADPRVVVLGFGNLGTRIIEERLAVHSDEATDNEIGLEPIVIPSISEAVREEFVVTSSGAGSPPTYSDIAVRIAKGMFVVESDRSRVRALTDDGSHVGVGLAVAMRRRGGRSHEPVLIPVIVGDLHDPAVLDTSGAYTAPIVLSSIADHRIADALIRVRRSAP